MCVFVVVVVGLLTLANTALNALKPVENGRIDAVPGGCSYPRLRQNKPFIADVRNLGGRHQVLFSLKEHKKRVKVSAATPCCRVPIMVLTSQRFVALLPFHRNWRRPRGRTAVPTPPHFRRCHRQRLWSRPDPRRLPSARRRRPDAPAPPALGCRPARRRLRAAATARRRLRLGAGPTTLQTEAAPAPAPALALVKARRPRAPLRRPRRAGRRGNSVPRRGYCAGAARGRRSSGSWTHTVNASPT